LCPLFIKNIKGFKTKADKFDICLVLIGIIPVVKNKIMFRCVSNIHKNTAKRRYDASLRFAATVMPVTPQPATLSGLKDPPSVYIQKNQVWNRLIVSLLGYELSQAVSSRNKFELTERLLDAGAWVVIGVFMPVLFDRLLNPRYDKLLRKRYFPHLQPHVKGASLLKMPFLYTDSHGIENRIAQLLKAESNKVPSALQELKKYGLRSFKELNNPKLLRAIRLGKVGILMLDLLVMASKAQLFSWGKNALTEKISGQKGYSGTLSYTSKAYREKEAQKYEAHKKSNQWLSIAIGITAAVALPVMVNGLLASKRIASGSGFMGKAKSLISKLDYTDAIFMSKWGIFWHDIFNWTLSGLFAARSFDEFREIALKNGAYFFAFYWGDEVISGRLGQWLQKAYAPKLEGHQLVQLSKRGVPTAVRLHKLYEAVGENSKHFAYKLGRFNYWAGLLGTSALLAGTTFAGNWYTRQKVSQTEHKQAAERYWQENAWLYDLAHYSPLKRTIHW